MVLGLWSMVGHGRWSTLAYNRSSSARKRFLDRGAGRFATASVPCVRIEVSEMDSASCERAAMPMSRISSTSVEIPLSGDVATKRLVTRAAHHGASPLRADRRKDSSVRCTSTVGFRSGTERNADERWVAGVTLPTARTPWNATICHWFAFRDHAWTIRTGDSPARPYPIATTAPSP